MPEVEKVKNVFQKIPDIYDKMNTVMSMGMDVFWRLELVKLMPSSGLIIDVGTGTGKLRDFYSGNARIIGIDITREMMFFTKHKGDLIIASGTDMPFRDSVTDGIMSSFVLRNLPSTEKYFAEAFRVLKNGGIIANLDAFPEHRPLVAQFFSLYFYDIMPHLGNRISKSDSYNYLANSVKNFKEPSVIKKEMENAGFTDVIVRKFRSPSACLIYGKKIQ